MDIISDLIATLGFPIAVCACLFFYIWKVQSKNNEALVTLTKVVENNTAALNKINERLDTIEDKIKEDK